MVLARMSEKRVSVMGFKVSSVSTAKCFVFMILLLSLLTGCTKGEKAKEKSLSLPGEELPKVRVALPKPSLEDRLSLPSSVRVEKDVSIQPNTAGKVESIYVDVGDLVKDDHVLAKLDDREARLTLDAKLGEMAWARREFERLRELQKRGAISESEVEEAKYNFERAERNVKMAQFEVEKCIVKAPFSGIISEKGVTVGKFVDEDDILFRVTEEYPLLAKVYVPEEKMKFVNSGTPIEVKSPYRGVSGVYAKLLRVSPVVDAGSGTREVLLEIRDGERANLRPGESVVVEFGNPAREASFLIPKRALTNRDGDSVYVVKDGKAMLKRLGTVELDGGDEIEATGLSQSDSVVIESDRELKEGEKVSVLP